MAKCSFKSTGRTFTLEVTEKSYSIEKNTSDVNWKLTISGGGTQWYDTYVKATVNGQEVYNQTKSWSAGSFPAKDGSVEGTITGIQHDNEGKKSISFALEGYSEVYTIQYDDGTLNLTTIPRASSISVTNYDLGQNPNIVIGKKVDTFTSTLKYKIGSRTGILVEKTSANSYVWAMPSTLISQIKTDNPNSREVKAIVYCDTYDGDTKIGSTTQAEFTLYITDKPIISSVVRKELNTNVSALTTKVMRHISQNQFTVTATAPSGTTIKNYNVENGTQKNTSTSNVIKLDDIQTFDSITNKTTFNFTANDNRTNSSNVFSLQQDFIDYVNVAINKTDVKITRTNGTETDAILYLTGNFYNGLIGSTQNKITITGKYKKQGDTNYTNLTNITPTYSGNTFKVNNVKLSGTYDYQETYEFVFTATDSVKETDDVSIVFTSSIPTELHHKKGAWIRELDTDKLKIIDADISNLIVYDSGDNYIRFTNGKMICWGSSTTDTLTWTQDSTIWYSRNLTLPDFPINFISVPIVQKSIQNMNTPGRNINICGNSAPTISNPGTYNLDTYWNATGTTVTVSYLAIGKWK